MCKEIQLLDCTLRDGGLGIEDYFKRNKKMPVFNQKIKDKILGNLRKSKVDIIELGAIEVSKEDKTNMAIYQNIETISEQIPKEHSIKQMYAALYRGPDTDLKDIPEWNVNYCEIVRVILRYSELKKSLEFCEGLSKKGYKVFVQPMLTMRYSEQELNYLIDYVNYMNAYALYFVDSYGYMNKENINYFTYKFNNKMKPEIKLGFHAHNNMNLAFANGIEFLSQEVNRDIIIDSCLLGMGQGAGNLQTELIADYLIKNYKKDYNYEYILNACEIIEKFTHKNAWGYTVMHLLPAINNTAYKYSVAMREEYRLTYAEINNILKNMPIELKHRFTIENLQIVLNKNIKAIR